ncbi:hypothetical protein [Skermania piniformis]|uniref:Uncharacterized protein n=1 Tax=Skermania pinensis TaxID=39122 RepID=A0ABX8S7L0_9ACTN|nr:hypothetical protein [Skermania piniformis]QXQ13833.1 hypothetical protein KV203_19000 [Skermania piniformis]
MSLTREEQKAAIRRYQSQTTYAPELPEGAELDAYGLPIIADHPDEDPDELL